MKLTNPMTSCGCLSVTRFPPSIDSGSSASIELALDTKGKFGRIDQSAILKSSGTDVSYIQMNVTAMVRGIWATPPAIDFGTVSRSSDIDRVPPRDVAVMFAGVQTSNAISASSNSKLISIEEVPAIISPDLRAAGIRSPVAFRVAWDCRAHSPVGLFNAQIVIETGESLRPRITVPVTAYIAGSVDLRPSHLLFGAMDPIAGKKCECKVRIKNATVRADELKYSTPHAFIDVEIVRQYSENGEACLDLRLISNQQIAAQPSGWFEGEVVAAVDDEVLFSVPYSGLIGRQK